MPDTSRGDVTVKKVTKNYEIIEVNGFKIKRRKSQKKEKPPPPEQQSLQTPQRTPNVEEYEISAALYTRLTKALHDFPESAPPSSRLLAVCSSVCAAEIDEVRGRGDEDIAVALESVFGDFMDGVAGAIDNESIKMASVVEPLDEDFKIDISSRRIGLQRRLDILVKEEREWAELLERVDSLQLDVPDIARDEGSGGAVIKDLAGDEIQGLEQLRDSIQKKISLQVEGVSLIVGNIEDLIEKANKKTRDAQKALHAERYKEYPHVNSPARLIKAIVRPDDI